MHRWLPYIVQVGTSLSMLPTDHPNLPVVDIWRGTFIISIIINYRF